MFSVLWIRGTIFSSLTLANLWTFRLTCLHNMDCSDCGQILKPFTNFRDLEKGIDYWLDFKKDSLNFLGTSKAA